MLAGLLPLPLAAADAGSPSPTGTSTPPGPLVPLLNTTIGYPPDHASGSTELRVQVPKGSSTLRITYDLIGDCPGGFVNRTGFALRDPSGLENHVYLARHINRLDSYGCAANVTEYRETRVLDFPALNGEWLLTTFGQFPGYVHFLWEGVTELPAVLDGGAPPATPPSHKHADFQVDPAALVRSIDRNGTVSLLMGDQGPKIVGLKATPMFANQTPMIQEENESGDVVASQAITARPYQGNVTGHLEMRAYVTVDGNGVYGSVEAAGTVYNFAPVSDEAPGNGSRPWVRVDWIPPQTLADSLLGSTLSFVVNRGAGFLMKVLPVGRHPIMVAACTSGSSSKTSGGSACPTTSSPPPSCAYGGTYPDCNRNTPSCGGPYQTFRTGYVKAYADHSFYAAYSDYGTRVTNAFNAQNWMWGCYTGVQESLLSVNTPSGDYSSSTDCTTQLNAFSSGHSVTSGVDAYQLFTGVNIIGSCTGMAQGTSAGSKASSPNSIVEARETNTGDTYNPGNSNHLGAVSGQEMAHVWGEPNHPAAVQISGKWNVMRGGYPSDWNTIGFWFTGGSMTWSANRIKAAWGI